MNKNLRIDRCHRCLRFLLFLSPIRKNSKLLVLPTKHLGVHMNSFKRVREFHIELEFGSVGFWGEGKTGVPREKPLGAREQGKAPWGRGWQGREPTTNLTHIWRRRRKLNPGLIGGRRALSPLRHPCSLAMDHSRSAQTPVTRETSNGRLFFTLWSLWRSMYMIWTLTKATENIMGADNAEKSPPLPGGIWWPSATLRRAGSHNNNLTNYWVVLWTWQIISQFTNNN